jgi:hypothetical protein
MAGLPYQGIVAGGRSRAYRASIASVRAEVEEEFAAASAAAGLWGRIVIRIRIRREVTKRMERIAPSGGLYARLKLWKTW